MLIQAKPNIISISIL